MYLDIDATTFFGGSHWLKALKLFNVGSTASPTLASETCKSPMAISSEAFYVWLKLEMFQFSAALKLLPAWGSSAASSCQHRAAAWAWPCSWERSAFCSASGSSSANPSCRSSAFGDAAGARHRS